MQRLFASASSVTLANITVDALEHLDSLEVRWSWTTNLLTIYQMSLRTYDFHDHLTQKCYFLSLHGDTFYFLFSLLQLFPSNIPDLSSESPLIVSGRYYGNLPNIIKLSGTLADMSNFTIDLKTLKAKDLPLNKVRFQLCGPKLYFCNIKVV